MEEKSENYKLDWNLHTEYLKSTFSDLLSNAYLSDVTLVTDDKKHFQAHKIILSACSQFFQNILVPYSVDFSHKPVVFLKGIKEQELTAILQFMYNGQAFFSEERTTQFLEAATTLEVTSIFQEQKKKPTEFETPYPPLTSSLFLH